METGRVVINLTTGHEDADRLTVAFLVAKAAQSSGHSVAMFLTKEAVRVGLPGYAAAVQSPGAPPVARLFEEYAAAGGELYLCPICFDARKLDPDELVTNARIAGATPLFDWIGDGAMVFSF